MPPVKNKTWDHAIVVLGVRGVGKSTYALGRAVELSRTPAYVLAHDPGYRLPEQLADGKPVKIHRHATVEEGSRALATQPSGVHAFAVPDGAEVLQLGKKVADASLQAHKGTHLVPVVVLIDEGVAMADASPHRLGDEMRSDLALLRHHNLGVIVTVQDPTFLHRSFMSLSTEIVLFRLNDEEAIRRTVRMGVPADIAEQARSLEKYKFIVHKQFG